MPKRLSIKQLELLKKHQFILKRLADANNKDRNTILKNAPSELYRVLSLVIHILSDQSLKLSPKQEKNIKKHRRTIKNTTDLKQTAIKRKLKTQRGGFLPAILSAALPVIAGIIKNIL
tara:strand:- start:77 stop:430 length:354 start_codon:yes stop_codon:yes gene_type:complete